MKDEKKELLEEAEQYKNAIKVQVNQSVDDFKKKGTNLLIVGGAVLAGFALVSLFTKSKKQDSPPAVPPQPFPHEGQTFNGYIPQPPPPPKKDSYFIRVLKQQVTNLALEVAKQTVKDLIGSFPIKPEVPKAKQNGQHTSKDDN